MFNQVSYNVVIERFKVFADGHFIIRRFSHGQVDVTDIDKDQLFPWMHVAPVDVKLETGSRVYSFDVIFADMPRDKEDATDYQREVISDCVRLCEDLVNEIANGSTVFGEDVELEDGSTITPFIAEYTHTLCGATLSLSISVPNDYSACDIPADWSIGGSGSATPPSPAVSLVLKVNGVDNVVQNVLDVEEGTNMTITDLGDGRVRFDSTGGGGGSSQLLCTEFNVNHLAATGNPYLVGDRVFYNGNIYRCIAQNDAILPTNTLYWTLVGVGFRIRQAPVDWNATTGDYQILNKPTIPAAQVNSDWNAVSGVAQILNKPILAAVATSGDYNDLINQPSIPSNLDDLADVNAPTPSNGQVLTWNGSQWVNSTPATGGTVTSVGLTMPSAFAVTGSPVTTAGTLAVTGAGTTSQYVRGDGTLANFPAMGGGGGQVFYFNGNISQGTIGGTAFYELGTAANTGPAANFTRATTGVIASFITDVGEPNHLIIPSGLWIIDVYLSETGGGSNNAEIIAVLKIYNGATFTTIASSPLEQITNGNVPDLYTFAISVPNTVTAATDRVVIEFDIQNTNGKTVTLYTEDGRIGEVHTTYAIGLSSLNGLTANTQTFATGTAGTDFGINSAGSVHTFNLPTASASNRGALSSADWATFNNKQNSIGLTTVGTNLATLPDPSAIRYIRINANNTVTAISLADLKTELGLGTLVSTSNQATSGTAWQDITGLTFPVTAGKTYKWRATVAYTITSGNINFAISGPTLDFTRYRFTAAATGTTNFVNNQTSYDTGTLVAGVNGCATSDGVIKVSASGTVAMRMRSSVGGALTSLAGSVLEWEEVL
jgi:hypothetical protein